MYRARPRAILLTLGLVVAVCSAGEASAECPSHYLCGTQTNRSPRGHTGCPTGEFVWDLPIGHVGATQMGGYVRDSLVLTGPPDGTPATVRMVVHASGGMRVYWPRDYVGADTQLFIDNVTVAGLLADISQLPPEFGFLERSIGEDIVVDVPVVTGRAFELMRGVHATLGARLDTFLRFENLPTGSRMTSCYGFTSEAPVWTERSTWGALKLRYR